ncbi:hypothetical protein D9M68_892660 [compost metagenome]
MAGDEDDGQGGLTLDQALLQLHAGHATHADVGYEASHLAGVVAAEKGLGRFEAADPEVLAFEQPLK